MHGHRDQRSDEGEVGCFEHRHFIVIFAIASAILQADKAVVFSGGCNSWTLEARACNCCPASVTGSARPITPRQVAEYSGLPAIGHRLDEHALQAPIGLLD